MRAKGIKIFHKIFLAYVLIGVVTISVTNIIQYNSRKAYIENSFRSQGQQFLNAAVDYFQEVYNLRMIRDLQLIAESPSLDNMLTSQRNEALVTRPNVEKLFLHFTRNDAHKYLSLRFIDAKGEEQVITEGNRRIREYISYDQLRDHSRDRLYAEIYHLYEELSADQSVGVIVSKPFIHENEYTLVAAIAKEDPEVLGFGGAVVLHISLSDFYDYISAVEVDGYPIIKSYTLDGEKIFDAYPGGAPYEREDESRYIVSANLIQSGSDQRPLFVVKSMIPLSIFSKEIHQELIDFLLIACFMMALVALAAYVLSRFISRPINQLVEGTKRISNGDLSTFIQVGSNDEIGLLTDQFNSMVRNLKQSNDRLTYEACHDVLTDLPNRALLIDRLDMLIRRYRRDSRSRFALLFIDLDRFKLVNDSMGHHAGDKLLQQISQRLSRIVRDVDTVGRLGGDEFVILMDQIATERDPEILAERLQLELDRPFKLSGQEIYVSCSVGIIISQPGYEQPSDYLRDADTAMYYAKSSHATKYKMFDETMRSSVMSTMQLEMDLRSALEQGQFVMYYQPIVCLKQMRIVRLEALIRWQHPERGFVQPDEFIHNAEETGMIVEIDRWVLRQVCQDIRRWFDLKLPPVRFNVNFSAKQFEQRGLIKQIREALSDNQVSPKWLGIEITETVAMSDVAMNIALLNQLHAMGITISIDDFGMGYSSLNSLKLFPVDHLKIDRHFIHSLEAEPDRTAIIEAIIVMAHKLGYEVVGKGVETETQLRFLRGNHCDQAQGYLFSRPVDFEAITKIINQPLTTVTKKQEG